MREYPSHVRSKRVQSPQLSLPPLVSFHPNFKTLIVFLPLSYENPHKESPKKIQECKSQRSKDRELKSTD
jgi:hypothetical protein